MDNKDEQIAALRIAIIQLLACMNILNHEVKDAHSRADISGSVKLARDVMQTVFK